MSVREIYFYDDYAHHPEEIKATLEAAKSKYPKRRIISVFQPHTYSRTKTLLKEFSTAFGGSDSVILLDIYASAREKLVSGVTGKSLADEVSKHFSQVKYCPNTGQLKSYLEKILKSGDIVIFMGAGDIYTTGRDIALSFK